MTLRRRRRGHVVLWGARRYDRQFGGLADRAYEARQRRIETAVRRISMEVKACGLSFEEAAQRMTRALRVLPTIEDEEAA